MNRKDIEDVVNSRRQAEIDVQRNAEKDIVNKAYDDASKGNYEPVGTYVTLGDLALGALSLGASAFGGASGRHPEGKVYDEAYKAAKKVQGR